MKLFEGLNLDKFMTKVMSDERMKAIDISDEEKRELIKLYARGYNDAYGRAVKGVLLGGAFGVLISCAIQICVERKKKLLTK